MTTGTFVQEPRTGRVSADAERYTVDDLARAVGMSTRNIRAHQTRGLLDPPVRAGRTAWYGMGHRRRLMTIRSLQEQGFNLVAIEAILSGADTTPAGASETDTAPAGASETGTTPTGVPRTAVEPDELTRVLNRVAAERPRLANALITHRVVRRLPDGTVVAVQTRLLRSALDLGPAGLSPALSLQVLAEVLDNLRPVADELGQATSARIVALMHRSGPPAEQPSRPIARDDTGLRRGLADLLAEVFRVTVGDNGRVLTGQRN
jgi:DNA-binding transcriptional MerR regulator